MLIIADMQIQVYSNPDMSRPPPSTHAMSCLLRKERVPLLTNPSFNSVFSAIRSCPIPSTPDTQYHFGWIQDMFDFRHTRHAIWFVMKSGLPNFTPIFVFSHPISNTSPLRGIQTRNFTFFTNQTSSTPTKSDMQFLFFWNPATSNLDVAGFQRICPPFPSLSFWLKSEHVQFPLNPTFNVTFVEIRLVQFPPNQSCIFVSIAIWTCPIPSKPWIQFHLLRHPDTS